MAVPAFVLKQFPPDMQEAMSLFGAWLSESSVRREDFTELKNIVAEIAGEVRELADAQKNTEIRLEELAVAQKRTEIRLEELAVAQKRTETRVEELAVEVKELAVEVKDLTRAMHEGFKKTTDQISKLGARWGIHNETVFRKTVEAILARTGGYTVRKGQYGGREVDVVVQNGTHILLEITASLASGDVVKMNRSAEDYQAREGVTPHLLLAAAYVAPSLLGELMASDRPIEVIGPDPDDERDL